MMSPALHAAANALCERLRSAGAGSSMATEEQYAALASAFGLPLPQWLSGLLQNYSLCGAELFWQAHPLEEDFDGRATLFSPTRATWPLNLPNSRQGAIFSLSGSSASPLMVTASAIRISSLWIRKTRQCIRSITTIVRRSTRSGRTRGD